MTFATNLQDAQQYAIPELFEFYYNGTYERYAAWGANISFLGNVYTSIPIGRLGYTENQFTLANINIRSAHINALSRYSANTPIFPTELTIYRALQNDLTQYQILFTGTVMTVSRKGFIYQAECSADAKVLESFYPSVAYQSYCNHAVFDSGCTLSDVDWRVQAQIISINNSDYSGNGLNLYVDGYFKSGTASYQGDERMISNHIGNVCTLHVPFDARVAIDTIVDFYPGCDGSPSTCKNKFNNWDNFLGMPLIPSSNPVIWGM